MQALVRYPEWLGVVDVLEMTGLDARSLRALVAADEFPEPVPHEITGAGPQWSRSEVGVWREFYESGAPAAPGDLVGALGAGWLVAEPEAPQ